MSLFNNISIKSVKYFGLARKVCNRCTKVVYYRSTSRIQLVPKLAYSNSRRGQVGISFILFIKGTNRVTSECRLSLRTRKSESFERRICWELKRRSWEIGVTKDFASCGKLNSTQEILGNVKK